MPAGVHVHISEEDLRDAARAVGVTERAAKKAARRAITKTARWMRTQAARDVSGATGIPQKHIRRRLGSYARGEEGMARSVWLGTNPIPAHRLGRARQTRRGVTVGRRRYPGAFMPWPEQGGPVFRREGQSRHPIERVEEQIAEHGEAAMSRLQVRAQHRFTELLSQELRYEMMRARGDV